MDKPGDIIYVIGNGFDLFHGLPSSFADFKAFVKKRNHNLYWELQNFYSPYDLWNDFEANLGLLNREMMLNAGAVSLPDPRVDFEDLQIADIYLAGDFVRGFLDELLIDIQDMLYCWVLGFKVAGIRPKIVLDPSAHFLNFNYTGILESVYHIDQDKINHIHGFYQGSKKGLIIGHGENPELLYKNWEERIKPKYRRVYINKKGERYRKRDLLYDAYFNERFYDPSVERIVDSIEEYFYDSVKNSTQIIKLHETFFKRLKDISIIYVLGHSISVVDRAYFEKIIGINRTPTTLKWIVAYHSESSKENLINNLYALGVRKRQIKMVPWNELS